MKSILVAVMAIVTALSSSGVVAARALQTPSQAQTGDVTVQMDTSALKHNWNGPITLKDAAGNPVQTVDLSLRPSATPTEIAFKNLPPGTYQLDFLGATQTVQVVAGMATTVPAVIGASPVASLAPFVGKDPASSVAASLFSGTPYLLAAAGLAVVGGVVVLANRTDSSPSR